MKQSQPSGERLWRVQEVADHLQVSIRTVWNLVADPFDPLPVIRIGKLVRFEPAALEQWLRRRAA